ncbi:hypothetical protein [Humibacter sp.]|uniref:hypothetical protein n=1 Tax=Humibacter sp. TaxID=1940291 RepID=UPI003F80F865
MTVTLDRTQLPVAARQKPDWAAYAALGVKSAAAGFRFADPTTGLTHCKLTDASSPSGGTSGINTPYSSAGLHVSGPWGAASDQYTLYVEDGTSGSGYLVDFQRGGGPSNVRRAGASNAWNSDLRGTFSYNAATPQIAYYANGLTLYRYNTATNALAASGNFPADFTALAAKAGVGGTQLQHVQTDINDRWFVFILGDAICAWDSQTAATDAIYVADFTATFGHDIDEPHFDKNGRYVLMVLASGRNVCYWDLQTDTFSDTLPTGTQWSHTEAMKGLFLGADAYTAFGYQQTYTPTPLSGGRAASPVAIDATKLASVLPDSQFGASVGGSHRSGQYVDQAATGTSQVAIIDVNAINGKVTPGAWSLNSGSIYQATFSYQYQQGTTGVNDVLQLASDGNTIAARLTPAASLAAMTAGSWFVSGTTVYVWRTDSASPDGTTHQVVVKVAQVCDDGIASVVMDGSDVRLAGHHYSFYNGYYTEPHTTQSRDGLLVVYGSNQGDKAHRTDVFVVEMPTTGASTADHLAVTTEPSASTQSGVAHAQQPAGVVQDSGNATVTSDTSTITATWVPDAGGVGVAAGTTSVVASAGVWTFVGTDLHVNAPLGETGHYTFTDSDGAVTGADSSTITITAEPVVPAGEPTTTALPGPVDWWRPQAQRAGLKVVVAPSPLLGTGGVVGVASNTVTVHIPVGRVRVAVLSLALDAMVAAAGSGTITVQVSKVTAAGVVSPLTSATSVKSDVVTAAGNIALPMLASVFDSTSGARVIDGTQGDFLRVDLVASSTISTQPQLRVVAELAVTG